MSNKYVILVSKTSPLMQLYIYTMRSKDKIDFRECTKRMLNNHAYSLEEAKRLLKHFYRYRKRLYKGFKDYTPQLVRLSKMKKHNNFK